ncbi:MAG: hypothetical protein JO248_05015 [Acidimicrobiia bacterium]|nr:hypothetical protein [Acidimicrobiia bacterium]
MARVQDSVVGRVKPGRMEDHLAMGVEVVKLFDRLGAEHPRLCMAIASGEPSGTFTFSTEYPSGEAWGEVGDAVNADAEFQAFIARVSAENAPSEILQFNTATEIPLRENNPTLGTIISVHVSRPIPGKFEEGLEQARRACELVERAGATNARCWQMGYAGMGSGMTMLSFEFADAKTCGRVGDMWNTDTDMVELAMQSRFGDAITSTPVFDGLYQVVPI